MIRTALALMDVDRETYPLKKHLISFVHDISYHTYMSCRTLACLGGNEAAKLWYTVTLSTVMKNRRCQRHTFFCAVCGSVADVGPTILGVNLHQVL